MRAFVHYELTGHQFYQGFLSLIKKKLPTGKVPWLSFITDSFEKNFFSVQLLSEGKKKANCTVFPEKGGFFTALSLSLQKWPSQVFHAHYS